MIKIKSLFVICMASLLFSCSTVMSRVESRPDWSLLTARIDQGKIVVDSLGTGETREDALNQAGISWDKILISSIGISLENDSELTTEQSLFLEKISQNREKALDPALPGKRLISLEKVNYKQDKGAVIDLYLQCSLSLEDFADLKREADTLFSIKNPLYEENVKQADKFAEEGNSYQAASKYLEAAVLSLENLPLNGDIFFHRYILEAAVLLSRLSLVPVSLPERALVDSTLTIPVSMDVQDRDVPFIVLFEQESPGGEKKKRKAQIQTNNNGLLSFYFPTPSVPGDYSLSFSFNMDVLPADINLPSYCSEALSQLYAAAEKLTLIHSVNLYQDIKQIPTLIVSRESDIAGNDLSSQWTSRELEKALQEKAYNITHADLDIRFISERNHDELIRDLRHLYRSEYQRVIFMETRITEYKQNKELFTLTASCSLEILNLVKGTVVSNFEDEASITLQDQRNMLPSVFSQLGQKLAEIYSR